MATNPADDAGRPAPQPTEPLQAEGVLGPAAAPVEPARATLTIDLGTLTPATVEAIKKFIEALANDPAKGAGTGPRPGAAQAGGQAPDKPDA